jgi:ubiquinone/menaquinone biosynthesis C-methylase UbiE
MLLSIEMIKKNTKRWTLAQEYERNWWDTRANDIDFEFYKNYSEELRKYLEYTLEINKNTTVLECGSGAGGILTYLKESENRYAIDPLEKFYSQVPQFTKQRDKEVKYFSAKGENLPFKNKLFDLVIMDNVLDHCDNPEEVIKEIKRVIKNNGILYFKQNTYHLWGKIVRYIMELFLIDRGHPYTFSKRNLSRLILSGKFKLLKSGRGGYFKTWKKEFFSKRRKDKIKALLLVNRDKVTYLLKNI